MKVFITGIAIMACLSMTASAAPSFFDDFEAGVGGTYTWTAWSPGPPANNVPTTSTDHNHTPGGQYSAKTPQSDPAGWVAYADFGAYGGTLYAEAYLYEDYNNDGTNPSFPVTNMFSLYGDAANPNAFTDYMQLGVVPFYPGGSQTYGFRTLYNDSNALGIIDTGVSRKAGWTKLSIEVDDLALGGQVRFFIDGTPVGTSYRAGANGGAGGLSPVDLRYVRIGNNNKSYETYWYDDVRVVPEPTGILLLLGGGLLALRRRTAR